MLRSAPAAWHIPALGFGVLATIVASAWAYGPRRMQAHERAVLDEARAILATPVGATLHAPTQGTTFAAAAIPALERIAQLSQAHPTSEADDTAAGRVRFGIVPASSLPAVWNLLLDEGSGAIDGLLHATRAPSMGDWPGLWAGQNGDRGRQFAQSIWLGAKLAGLRIRRRIEARDVSSALDDCADLFALARDVAVRGGSLGFGYGEDIARVSMGPCAAAIDRSSAGDAEQLRQRLDGVRAVVPLLVQTLREDHVSVSVFVCGWMMRTRGLRIPEPFLVSPGPEWKSLEPSSTRAAAALVGLWTGELFIVRFALRQAEEADLWSRIAALPEPERRRQALAMREEVARWHDGRSGLLHSQPPDMVRIFARHTLLSARFELLSAAARERAHRLRHGRWMLGGTEPGVHAAESAGGALRLTVDADPGLTISGLKPPPAPSIELHATAR